MDINFNHVYIFVKPKNGKIVLMKVEEKKDKAWKRLSRFSVRIPVQNYIRKSDKKGWKKISMEDFNDLGLKYVGQYYNPKKTKKK